MFNNGFENDRSKTNGTTLPKSGPEKTPRNSFRQLLKQFASDTSFGGISKATLSDGHLRRFVWALISATCYGFTIYMCYTLTKSYLDKPVSTAVDIVYEKNIDFPSVTVCNMNQFRHSKVIELPEVAELLRSFRKRNKSDESSSFERSFSKKTQSLKKGVSVNSDIEDDHDSLDGVDIDEKYVMEDIVASAIAYYTVDELTKVGHHYKDMFISCTWMGLNCKTGYFAQFWTPSWNWKYGNCFTFNPGANLTGHLVKVLRTTMPGPNYGLSLDVNIQQGEYISELTDEAGIKVVIHNPRQMPFPYDEGITLPPGFSSSVALRKESITRVDPFKNGSCNPRSEIEQENIYRKYHSGAFVKYSVKACMLSCLAQDQQRMCNCSDFQFAHMGLRICEDDDQTCMNEVNSRYKKDEIGCSQRCPQPCLDQSYRYSVMMSSLTVNAKEGKKKEFGENKTDDDFTNNFLRVKIFYDELNLQKIVQSTPYGLDNLLGDIGGQLGLWIGISVISVAEFGELLISLMVVAFRKSRGHNKTRTSEIELH